MLRKDGVRSHDCRGLGKADRLHVDQVGREGSHALLDEADVLLVREVAVLERLGAVLVPFVMHGLPQAKGRDEQLEGRHAGAEDGNVELDHGPHVDRNCVVEWIGGEGVGEDAVQAHNRHDES